MSIFLMIAISFAMCSYEDFLKHFIKCDKVEKGKLKTLWCDIQKSVLVAFSITQELIAQVSKQNNLKQIGEQLNLTC